MVLQLIYHAVTILEVPNATCQMLTGYPRITNQRFRRYTPNNTHVFLIEQRRYQINRMTGVFHAHAKLQFAMDKSLQAVQVD